jgi:hypothetical protein
MSERSKLCAKHVYIVYISLYTHEDNMFVMHECTAGRVFCCTVRKFVQHVDSSMVHAISVRLSIFSWFSRSIVI